ncbi:MAG: DUF3040 domain-containing protein [Actinomycetales bacterium]|nr:DUF3040 domain-containing protein [Actinomycetales bacterium]
MPLSEFEQRVLEQMERQLASDDPRLASTMQSGGHSGMRHWIVAGLGAVVGLLALVGGAALSQVWLGVVGFLVMFAAVAYGFSPPRRKKGPQGVVGRDGSVAPRRPAARRQPFMSRLEERWDRRRDERGR